MRANPYASGPLPPKKPSSGGPGLGSAWAIVVLLVLCIVGGLVALTLIPASYRADEAAEPLPPVWAQQSAAAESTLVVPVNLGNRRMISDYGTSIELEHKIGSAMALVPGISDNISATYGTSSGNSSLDSQHVVTFNAGKIRPALQGTALAQDPFDRLREHANISAVSITDVVPGPLAGQAKCGKANMDGYITVVCAWADRFTVGLIIFYGSTLEEASAEFITVRGAIERHG